MVKFLSLAVFALALVACFDNKEEAKIQEAEQAAPAHDQAAETKTEEAKPAEEPKAAEAAPAAPATHEAAPAHEATAEHAGDHK